MNVVRPIALAWLVVAVAAAGCLGETSEKSTRVGEFPFAFWCSATTYEPRPGTCAATIGADGDTWAEPELAAGAAAGLFALAMQGKAALQESDDPLAGLPGLAEETESTCASHGLCLFVTQDAGASWVRRDINAGTRAAPDGPWLAVDPALAFQNGRLLVGGLSSGPAGIVVAGSSDLGQTWDSRVQVVTGESADRPWLAANSDELVLVWQTAGEQEGFWSRSADGGRTWSEPITMACNVHSKPVWVDGVWWVACNAESGSWLVELDEEPKPQSTFPQASGTLHLSGGGEKLWFARPGSRPSAHASEDLRHWSSADLVQAVPPAEQWGRSFITGMAASPDGGLLLLISLSDGGCVVACDEQQRPPVRMIHVDASAAVVSHVQLTPIQAQRPVQPAQELRGGEFESIACQEVCLVAWMTGGLVDVARLEGR